MYSAETVKDIKTNLKYFRAVQAFVALICLFMPLIFRFTDNDQFYPKRLKDENILITEQPISAFAIDSFTAIDSNRTGFRFKIEKTILKIQIDSLSRIHHLRGGFRDSMSDYTYGSASFVFGIFYCMAAMLFIFDGALFRSKSLVVPGRRNVHKYNILIGACLLLAAFFPYRDYWCPHITFTIAFFVVSMVVVAFFSNEYETRTSRRIRKIVAALTVVFLLSSMRWCFVLYGEWLGLTVIGLHMIRAALATHRKLRMITSDPQMQPDIGNAMHLPPDNLTTK